MKLHIDFSHTYTRLSLDRKERKKSQKSFCCFNFIWTSKMTFDNITYIFISNDRRERTNKSRSVWSNTTSFDVLTPIYLSIGRKERKKWQKSFCWFDFIWTSKMTFDSITYIYIQRQKGKNKPKSFPMKLHIDFSHTYTHLSLDRKERKKEMTKVVLLVRFHMNEQNDFWQHHIYIYISNDRKERTNQSRSLWSCTSTFHILTPIYLSIGRKEWNDKSRFAGSISYEPAKRLWQFVVL